MRDWTSALWDWFMNRAVTGDDAQKSIESDEVIMHVRRCSIDQDKSDVPTIQLVRGSWKLTSVDWTCICGLVGMGRYWTCKDGRERRIGYLFLEQEITESELAYRVLRAEMALHPQDDDVLLRMKEAYD